MVDEQEPVVGFIGLGDQGLPIATAIAQAGYVLHAWDQNPDAVDALGDVAHVRHDSITTLAGACDIVGLCVSTDDDVFDVVAHGLLGELRAGSIVINHGTGTPANALRLTEICARAGIDALDAPVSGGRPAALARTLTTMVGGAEAAAGRCRPLFESFCRHVFYVGGPGLGQLVKLFNNTLMMMNQANIADVVELSVSAGLDPDQLVAVLKVSSGNSRALELLNTLINPDTVEHLTAVQMLDMEIFASAMDDCGVNAQSATARGIEGTDNLVGLLRRLNP